MSITWPWHKAVFKQEVTAGIARAAGVAFLTPAQRIGPFQIVALLGRGGMGEVFLANDTRLDRKVAIKVLPDSFARDKERLARFAREAQVLASLNHPSIAGIYGLEESGDTRALVETKDNLFATDHAS